MRDYSETEFNQISTSQINHNRKLINTVLTKISNEKNSESHDNIGKSVLIILNENTKDITSIYDEEENNFVHILVRDDKLESLCIIVEAYYLALEREAFYAWFTAENSAKLTPLDIAAQKGNRDIIRYLFGKISRAEEKVLRLDEKRNSFFHYAAKKNQTFPIVFFYEQLQRYFPNKKIIDNPNEHLITPLHYACFHHSMKVVDLLLDLGANINALDCNLKSVLSYAVYSGSAKLVTKLLLRGADKYLKDENGKTAYDFAIEKGMTHIAKLLKPKSFFQKAFCNQIELSSIKGIRNDDIAALAFILYFIFAILYLHSHDKILNSNDHLFIDCSFYLCLIGMGFVGLAFLLLIYFTSFFKREQSHYEVIQEGLSLVDLLDHSDEICVKCKRNIPDDTIHCLVCDVCVDEWDHHCFWLNTCIDSSMKFKFNLFFGSLVIGVIINLVFGIINLYLLSESITAWTVMFSIFVAIFVYLVLFILLPLCCFIIPKKDELNITNASEYEDKLLNHSTTKSIFT